MPSTRSWSVSDLGDGTSAGLAEESICSRRLWGSRGPRGFAVTTLVRVPARNLDSNKIAFSLFCTLGSALL